AVDLGALLVLAVLVGRHVRSLRRVWTGNHTRHRIRGAGDHLMLRELEELRIRVPLRQRRGSSEGHERAENSYCQKLPHLNSSPSCLIWNTESLRLSIPATSVEHSRTGRPSRSCYLSTRTHRKFDATPRNWYNLGVVIDAFCEGCRTASFLVCRRPSSWGVGSGETRAECRHRFPRQSRTRRSAGARGRRLLFLRQNLR